MGTRIVIHHRAEDGDAWLEHFIREGGGQSGWQAERSAEDPDELVVTQRFSSRADAEAFLGGSELAQALRTAGVGEDSVRVEVFDEHEPPPGSGDASSGADT